MILDHDIALHFNMHKQFVGKPSLSQEDEGEKKNSPEKQRGGERIKNRNLSSLGLFLPSRHFVACEKMCCIFEVLGHVTKEGFMNQRI